MENERLILKELGFSIYRLVKDDAHKWLVQLLTEVFHLEIKELIQKAWSYINDCYATVSVACFAPSVIATSCLHLAMRTGYPKL
jgi:hypothetical protein